ncbi:transposase, partial [Acetobacter cerevisiae]
PPDRQISLTDPDSRLMRRSDAHEFRQAYNAQAVVCAEGSQLIVTTDVVATSADAPSFASTVLSMENTIGLPKTVLADTGYANGQAVRDLRKKGIDPLVAIGRPRARRPYDFRPPPENTEPRRITEPWRLAMKDRLETTEAGDVYRLRKQTVEPVFGIIKSIMGFRRFSLRSLAKVTTEWTLVALAYNCKRMARLHAA